MSRSLGPEIPAPLRPLLAGEALAERAGLTFVLLTTDAEGWPHVTLLSVGELVARDARHLLAALWPSSTATASLARSGKATLAIVHSGAGYYLRCSARRVPDLALSGGLRAAFALVVEDALEDTVPYAELTSGITFRLADPEPEAVVRRWAETIRALRATGD